MHSIVVVSGSPMANSRSALLGQRVQSLLAERDLKAVQCNVRDLPAEALLWGHADAPEIRGVLNAVAHARGLVVCSPIYKAAYTGVLKLFLDLLPQSGLAGKVVLPLVTAGTLSHMLAIDYALRPVLTALGAEHVQGGLLILDKQVGRLAGGELAIEESAAQRLVTAVAEFARIVVHLGEVTHRSPIAGAT